MALIPTGVALLKTARAATQMASLGPAVKIAFVVTKYLAWLAVAFWLASTLRSDWQELAPYWTGIDYLPALGAELLLLAIFVLETAIWRSVIDGYGTRVSFANAFVILSISRLAAYVPGRVWQFVGLVYLGRQAGLPAGGTLMAGITLQVLTMAVGSALTMLFWLVSPMNTIITENPNGYLLFGLVIVGAGAACSPFGGRLLSLALKAMGRTWSMPLLSFHRTLMYAGLFVVNWICLGLGFYLLARSIYPVPAELAVTTAGTFGAGYIIGYLSIIFPGGLGVREGILSYLLGLYLPAQVALLIAVVSRLWMVSAELACGVVALVICAVQKGSEERCAGDHGHDAEPAQ